MKNIYYLYSYATSNLLYITTNKSDYEKAWNLYERQGVECWGLDSEAMANNERIEQKELEQGWKEWEKEKAQNV